MNTSDGSKVSLTLESVLAHYGASVKTYKTGWQTIRCPFHSDHTPTGRVNLGKGIYWCPVDGVMGDAIHVIMAHERLEIREAREFARNILGASYHGVPRTDERPKRKRWRKDLFGGSRDQ